MKTETVSDWQKHLVPNNWPKISDLAHWAGKIEIDRCGRPSERWEHRCLIRMSVPFALRPLAQPDLLIRFISINRHCNHSLQRILASIERLYEGTDVISKERINLFGGSYIPHNWLLTGDLEAHAYGAAFRLGGATDAVREIFEAESWRPIGKDKLTFVAAK